MFSQYTWGDFFKIMIPLTVIYYVIVGLKFYRKTISDFVFRRKSDEIAPKPASDPDFTEDDSDLFETVSYPITPASVGVGAQTLQKPKKERKKREKKEAKKTIDQTTEPSLAPQPTPQEIELAGAPIANEGVGESFLGDLTGISTPLAEESLDSIIQAAKELSVDDKGSLTTKPEASEGAQRLARLAHRKSLPADIDNLPFNR